MSLGIKETGFGEMYLAGDPKRLSSTRYEVRFRVQLSDRQHVAKIYAALNEHDEVKKVSRPSDRSTNAMTIVAIVATSGKNRFTCAIRIVGEILTNVQRRIPTNSTPSVPPAYKHHNPGHNRKAKPVTTHSRRSTRRKPRTKSQNESMTSRR